MPWIARKVLSPEVTSYVLSETLLSPFFFQCVYCCYCDCWSIAWCCLHVKVLCKLSSLSEASVTRRSAGLPLIINTILASEARIKQVSYVSITSVYFLECCSRCGVQLAEWIYSALRVIWQLPSKFVNGHLLIICFIVCCWLYSHIADLARPCWCKCPKTIQ